MSLELVVHDMSSTSRITYVGQFSVGKTEGGRRSGRTSPSLETLPGYVEMPLIFVDCP